MWLSPDEIEAMMEDELRRASLLPEVSAPAVDVEAFLEQHLRVGLNQYADLPKDVLGLTEFFTNGTPKVSINRDLTGSAIDDDESAPGLLGRWRATLAHEAAHVVIHRPLFELAPEQGSLFGEVRLEQKSQLMRCQKSNVLYRNGGADWREVQANRGMAALLMPPVLFRNVVRAIRSSATAVEAGSRDAKQIVGELAERFSVSKQAAEIRLATLGLLTMAGQHALPR